MKESLDKKIRKKVVAIVITVPNENRYHDIYTYL